MDKREISLSSLCVLQGGCPAYMTDRCQSWSTARVVLALHKQPKLFLSCSELKTVSLGCSESNNTVHSCCGVDVRETPSFVYRIVFVYAGLLNGARLHG